MELRVVGEKILIMKSIYHSDIPLEGFDYHLPMIYGGVNLERF